MEPVTTLPIDRFLVQLLYPNYQKSYEVIEQNFRERIVDYTSKVRKADVAHYFGLINPSKVVRDHYYQLGLKVLFQTDPDDLSEHIYDRVERYQDILFRETSEGTVLLLDAGKVYFSRCWTRDPPKIEDLELRLVHFVFNPKFELRFPPTTLIAQNIGEDSLRFVTLELKDVKNSELGFRKLLDNTLYIRGYVDHLGSLTKIQKIRLQPVYIADRFEGVIVGSESHSTVGCSYLVKRLDPEAIFHMRSSIVEPFVPLDQRYWYYNEEKYLYLREEVELEVVRPIIRSSNIDGAEQCLITHGAPNEFEETIDLMRLVTRYRDKEVMVVEHRTHSFVVIPWEEVEEELGITRNDLKKERTKLKRAKEGSLLVDVEAVVARREIRRNKEGFEEHYYYLGDLYLRPLFELS